MGSMVSSIFWVIQDLDHQPYYGLGLGSQSHNKDGLLGSNSMRVVYIWNLWNSAAEVKLGGIRKRRWLFFFGSGDSTRIPNSGIYPTSYEGSHYDPRYPGFSSEKLLEPKPKPQV